jgi:uncharacterized protein
MRIDVHGHVWAKDGALNRPLLDRLIVACDKLGMDEVWISCPVTGGMGDPEIVRRYNDIVLEAVRAYPTRLRGYCFLVAGYQRQAMDELSRCLDAGMIGIKLYHQYFINDPVLFPFVERSIDLGIPILCHAGHVMDWQSRRSQPNISDGVHFADVGRRYPEATIIMAHIGGGGDYEWSLQALADCPSVMADTSGSVIDDGMVEYAVRLLGPQRVIFACDETEEGGVGKVLAADLSEDVREAIFWRNARAILARRK